MGAEDRGGHTHVVLAASTGCARSVAVVSGRCRCRYVRTRRRICDIDEDDNVDDDGVADYIEGAAGAAEESAPQTDDRSNDATEGKPSECTRTERENARSSTHNRHIHTRNNLCSSKPVYASSSSSNARGHNVDNIRNERS